MSEQAARPSAGQMLSMLSMHAGPAAAELRKRADALEAEAKALRADAQQLDRARDAAFPGQQWEAIPATIHQG